MNKQEKKMLNVPLILQPVDSFDCGIAGIVMILNYHGLKITFDEAKKDIETDKTGTYAPQLGQYLIGKGLKVTLTTLHPKLFTINDEGMDSGKIILRLNELMEKTKSEQDKKVFSFFLDFLRKGGEIEAKIPSLDDIKREIDAKNPVGALMTTNVLNGKAPKFNFHFNLITGYDEKHIFTNDPAWDERGGKKKYNLDEFFYALFASIYGDIDNGCLIKVRK